MYSDTDGAAFFALLAAVWTVTLIFAIAGYLISAWFLMKIFEKAGVQGKWRAWVPFYNTLIFAKLGDLNPWWLLILWGAAVVLGWLPVIGWLFGVAAFAYTLLAAWRVGLKLQKEPVWLILYAFLSIVWLGILAFDKSRWNTNIPPAPWAGNFLADKTKWDGVPVQPSAVYAAPSAVSADYPPPSGDTPQGYAPPPQGYQAPPQGYQPPPQGYQPPPPGYQAPPSAAQPPAPPSSAEPPAPPSSADPPAARPIDIARSRP